MTCPARVLVVDDELAMRESLAEILTAEGYAVDMATSGEAALDACRRQRYEVVLMDVQMAGISGVEAFRVLRREQPGIRVVLMSAHPPEELRRAALREGAVAFLAKPLDIDLVIRLVANAQHTAVLVVEQDDATASSLQALLHGQGCRTTTAVSAYEALQLIEQLRFELVFIEVALPAMNGLDLYLAIRRHDPGVTAIMLAAAEEPWRTLAREAVQRTAYAALDKPLDFGRLPVLLRRIVSQRLSNVVEKPSEGDV